MSIALWLLFAQGLIGAFDTLYFHKWCAHLPGRGRQVRAELTLHALRDYLYAIIFCSLPWFRWQGGWCAVLLAVLALEIALTMWDFVAEAAVRKPFGDVYPAERVTHAVMGIVYVAMLACMAPTLAGWIKLPSGLAVTVAPVPAWLRWALTVMGVGVLASGLRVIYAAFELPGGGWPWAELQNRQAPASWE